MLKILFSLGLMIFSWALQKLLQDRQQRLLRSSLLHSLMTFGKKEFWKYSHLQEKESNSFGCLAEVLMDEIRLLIYLRTLIQKIL